MPGECAADDRFAAGQVQGAAGAGDAGVEQFAAEHSGVAGGQLQPDGVELAALGLVHGHGEGAFVGGQGGRVEAAHLAVAVAFEPGDQRALGTAVCAWVVAVGGAAGLAWS